MLLFDRFITVQFESHVTRSIVYERRRDWCTSDLLAIDVNQRPRRIAANRKSTMHTSNLGHTTGNQQADDEQKLVRLEHPMKFHNNGTVICLMGKQITAQ